MNTQGYAIRHERRSNGITNIKQNKCHDILQMKDILQTGNYLKCVVFYGRLTLFNLAVLMTYIIIHAFDGVSLVYWCWCGAVSYY